MNVSGGDSCHQFLTLHVNRLQQQLGTERREMRQIKGGTLKIMVAHKRRLGPGSPGGNGGTGC